MQTMVGGCHVMCRVLCVSARSTEQPNSMENLQLQNRSGDLFEAPLFLLTGPPLQVML